MVRSLIVALLCLVCANALTAQTVQNTCVEVSAVAQVSPPQITFNWPVDATALGYTVYRRAIGAASWGSALTTLPAGAITWVDTGVALGQCGRHPPETVMVVDRRCQPLREGNREELTNRSCPAEAC